MPQTELATLEEQEAESAQLLEAQEGQLAAARLAAAAAERSATAARCQAEVEALRVARLQVRHPAEPHQAAVAPTALRSHPVCSSCAPPRPGGE